MMIKDVIPGFELYRPTTIDDAVALLDEHKADVWKLAGGNDSLSWFKDRVKRPKVVVDISGIAGMRGVKETPDGIEIGALTTISEIEKNPLVNKSYKLLAEAAGKVASPQIRNTGTIGGNVSQDARCWYYRSGLPCYRAGGNTCFSDTPEGQNREHALFDANRCVAVTQSDMAPTMIALDAKMVIRNAKGLREVKAEEFFVGPRIDITRLTQLKPEDLLVAIRIPKEWAGAKFYFEKVTDRSTWDFALVNVAAAVKTDASGAVANSRIAVGGVAATPRRCGVAEQTIKGQKVDQSLAELAGKAETRGAHPLNYNAFKVPLMASLVMRAVRDAQA
ncbi:MAG TPA: xanthine dehydrogenase family protein subunit M [Xanthobacteraceae bacterium]|nr:xanthine dehydrogenase family protein subunit M [Xanthobacteraceae bacterium]